MLIPAKNEESNLPACLESVARADEVFVVDSQSSDRSIKISTNYGANVVQFYFNGRWPKKKNWSLDNLPFRNQWVLIVDCDERITPELWDEIASVIQDPNYNGYYLNLVCPQGLKTSPSSLAALLDNLSIWTSPLKFYLVSQWHMKFSQVSGNHTSIR